MSQSVSQPTSHLSAAVYGRASLAAALLSAGLMFASAAAQAQTVISVEGALMAVTDLGGGNGTVVCNSTSANIVPTTVITSPTTTLTMAQLADPTAFPNSGYNPNNGAAKAGFIGGHCIVDGVRDDLSGVTTADTVFQEIVENTLLGPVTNSPALGNGAFAVFNTPVVALTDPRMSAVKPASGMFTATGAPTGSTEVARNQFGFGVDLNTVGLPAPDVVSLQGYFGNDSAFYAHTIDTTGGTLLVTDPRPALQRAQCRNSPGAGKDVIDIRGGCILSVPGRAQSVTLSGHRADGTLIQTYATVTCVPDNVEPAYGAFLLVNSKMTYTADACPAKMRATLAGVPDNRRDYVTPDAR
jgi:hypothetical protein